MLLKYLNAVIRHWLDKTYIYPSPNMGNMGDTPRSVIWISPTFGLTNCCQDFFTDGSRKFKTSAPIEAWKWNLPPFLEIMTDRPTTDRPGNIEVSVPIAITYAQLETKMTCKWRIPWRMWFARKLCKRPRIKVCHNLSHFKSAY